MYKTWIEIDRGAARHNVRAFKKIISPKTKLWAVVKSNAYGHGLVLFSKILATSGVQGFCVDSVIEGLTLRQHGVKKPILVLGPTLSRARYVQAKEKGITVTVSTFEALRQLQSLKNRAPQFHIKIDTGMHRQGFLLTDIKKCILQITNYPASTKVLAGRHLPITGLYTHFAAPADKKHRTFTAEQFSKFITAVAQFERAGFTNLVRHAASTGGVLADMRYALDAVRVGAGLYGFCPSSDVARRCAALPLKPVLSWRSVISEIKMIPKGDSVGYGRLFRATRPTRIAVVPIGYWHGIDRRAFPGLEVLVRGKRAPLVGKVSMDIVTLDATDVPVRVGDQVTFIGRDGKEEITAQEFSERLGTTAYEGLTRINPLITHTIR